MMLGLFEVRSVHILMRSLMLGVSDFVGNLMVGKSMTFLDERLKVEITMPVITVEWLMIELMVLRAAMVTVDNGIVVGGLSVVTFSNAAMLRSVMDGPRVHFWTGNWQLVAVSSIRMVSGLSMLLLIYVSFSFSNLSMGCLMVLVGLVDLSADNFVIVSMSVQGESLVSVAMLNSVLSRSLDLVEKLVVLMLDIVHYLGTSVVAHIMLISVTWVIGVSCGVVSEILILFIMVIVVVSSPESSTFVMFGVFLMTIFMVGRLAVLCAEVLMAIVSVVMASRVSLSVVECIFTLCVVRFVQRILLIMTAFMMSFSLFSDVFMMDLTFGVTSMEASMLISPKKLIV